MSYRLRTGSSLNAEVQRLFIEQIDGAAEELAKPKSSRVEAIHQARKRFKKIRGLLRLVRGGLDPHTYGEENAFFRDAARKLSRLRDADVFIQQFDALADSYCDAWLPDQFAPVREALVRHREAVAEGEVDIEDRVEAVLRDLAAARQRLENWHVAGKGYNALAVGFADTYTRGRKAMAAAQALATLERFHEWRKRAKYHWYHVRLLQDVWPKFMKARRGDLRKLTERLGDDHDLGVLRSRLVEQPSEYGAGCDCSALLAVIDHHRAVCQEKAWALGERLYAEKPDDLIKRIRRRWRTCGAGTEGDAR